MNISYNFYKNLSPYLRHLFMKLQMKIKLYSLSLIVLLTACSNNQQLKVDSPETDSVIHTTDTVHTVKKDTVKAKVFHSTPIVYDTTKKYIYLTFDDGPQNGTQICMDICKSLDVKATFFMVGEHACSPKTNSLVDSIRNGYPLFLLANHSYSHANGQYHKFYHQSESTLEDFLRTQKKLQVPLKIIRLPGNSAWVRKNEIKASSLVKPVCLLLDSAGYNIIGWDLEWDFTRDKHCFPRESVTKMLAWIERCFTDNDLHTKNHLVILSHDRMFQHQPYSDSLNNFIKALKQNPNYVLETIDHYPGLKH